MSLTAEEADTSAESIQREDRPAPSTPEPQEPATAASTTSTTDADSTVETSNAPGESDGYEQARQVMERLEAGDDPSAIRRGAAPATPSQPSNGESAGETGTQASDAGEPPQATGDGQGYEGLNPDSQRALSRAHLLPPPEVWKATPSLVRANLVKQAKSFLAEKDRAFQQTRQRQGQPAAGEDPDSIEAPSVGDESADGATDPDDAGETGEVEPTDEGTAAGVSGQRPAAGQRKPHKQAASAVAGAIKKLKETYGEEIAGPIQELADALGTAHEQRLAAIEQHVEAQRNDLLTREMQRQENEAFKALEAKFPQFKDKSVREQVRKNARAYALAMLNAGEDALEATQAIEFAAGARFYPDTQRSAQKALLDRRASSLRGTPERGTAQTKPTRAMSDEERAQLAYQKLEAGQDPEQVRRELS